MTSFTPGSRLSISGGADVEVADGRARVLAGGEEGWALFGPYAHAQAGIHRVTVRAHVEGGEDALAHVDVFDASAEWRTFGSRRFHDGAELIVRLYDTDHLEFRFRSLGAAFTVDGVELAPLLLDTAPASASDLRAWFDRIVGGAGEANAVYRVLDRLADLKEYDEAARLRAEYVASRGSPKTAVEGLLVAMNSPGWSYRPLKLQQKLDHDEVREVVWARGFLKKNALELSQDDRDALRVMGYEADFIDATRFYRHYEEPRRLWHERPLEGAALGVRPPRQPLFERYVDIDRSFQASMASGLGFTAYCPVTGKRLVSHHGFLIHFGALPFAMYRFEGVEVFYVCTGYISNTKIFMFMPRTNLIVYITEPSYRHYQSEDLTRNLLTDMATYPEQVHAYLQEPGRPAAAIGSNIFGHYFWASLTGLEYVVESGLAGKIVEVVQVEKNYVDPIEIFPEFATLPMSKFKFQEDAFLHCVVRGLLPIHFTDVAMTESFIDRLRRVSARKATSAGRPLANAPRPLIWLNLRAHSKIWVDQAEGVANIMNAVYERYGAAAGFLDGMPDCAAIAAEIRAKIRPEIPLYDGLHLSVFDTINWSFLIDSYVCPIGSGLMMTNVIGGKPGVGHAEHAHLQQMEWWTTYRQGIPEPLVPDFSQVEEIGEGLYCDYRVDWRILFDLLTKVLDEIYPVHGVLQPTPVAVD